MKIIAIRGLVILVFVAIFLLNLLGVFGVRLLAAATINPADIGLDTSLVQEDRSYSIPQRILVTPIFIGDKEKAAKIDEEDWFKGLYYFMIANTNRSGFTDIPFHYAVTKRGQIYTGNSGKDERRISIKGIGDDSVVIAYLADSSSNSFDIRARQSLADIILDVANRNHIKPNNVMVQGVKMVRDSEEQVVRLEKVDVFGLWKRDLDQIVSTIRGQYKPNPKRYDLAVEEVELPDKKIESGETVNASVTIANNGDTGIYQGTSTEIIATKKGSSSKFYINNEWLSPTQFPLMKDGDVLLPGEKIKFSFKLYAPLFFGKQTETFVLENITGSRIGKVKFNVQLDIKKPAGATIVEILPTQFGWLRLRSTPNGVEDNEIGRLSTGDRFIQVADKGNGWIRVRLPNGVEGWISKAYVKYL